MPAKRADEVAAPKGSDAPAKKRRTTWLPLWGMAQATLSARFAGIHLGWREAPATAAKPPSTFR